jgi:thiamine pyrophosphate-dependent acetolactate synthase large subunit-like protein
VNAREVVEALAAVRGDASIVTGPGALSGATFVASPDPATIYNMELGYATATAMGVALALPQRRAVALEGDGSFVAGISVLTTIARYRPANLVVVVVDNGIYGTGSGMVATATSHGTDIAAIARACGLPDATVSAPTSRVELDGALELAMTKPGPWLIHVRVDPDASQRSANRPRPSLDFVEASLRFQAAVRDRN